MGSRSRSRATSGWRRAAGVVIALGVTVAACSGDDDDATPAVTDASDVSDASAAPDATITSPDAGTAASTTASDDGGPSSSDAPSGTAVGASALSNAPTVEGDPVRGGTLVYGLEGDTSNPWAPYRATVTAPGMVVLATITDPLFVPDPEGAPVPHLLESAEPNADFTQWTFTVRDGVRFHDGTPFDGAALKVNLDACRAGALSRSSYSPITGVQADGQVVTITTDGPWVALPAWFATINACSWVLSAEWLMTLDDLPQRDPESPVYDEAIAALPGGGDPAKPVGLGAFRFESYAPGNGNSVVTVRNDDYWRGEGPDSTGEGLPYLDGVELVVATDINSRSNTLRAGGFDIIHTSNADEIAAFLEDDGFETRVTDTFGETYSIMLNLAEGGMDAAGENASNPLLQRTCRRALAMAIDGERLNEERNAGLASAANGPFPPGAIGHLDDTGYPTYDPEAAAAEFEQCLADAGTDRLQLRFDTWNDPVNLETNSLVVSMWREAFGDRVDASITALDIGQYAGLAIVGDFEMLAWRAHGGIDPDQQRRWWHSSTAQPIGEVGLNYPRRLDPVVDENFDIIRTDPDPAVRKAAAEAINRRFGEEVTEFWLYWVIWAAISQPYVNGVEVNELPAGGQGATLYSSARHQMAQLWCDGGSCE